jgi:hypothetical protein
MTAKFFSTTAILIFSIVCFGQVIVYQDDFSNNTSNTSGPYTGSVNGISPNNTKWHYTENDGGWSIAYNYTSSEMRLINNYNTDDSYGTAFLNKRLGGSLSPVGTDGVYGTYQTSNPNYIKDDFTNNVQTLEWSFLFFISSSSNLGLSNGATYYGGAFVIGAEYNNIQLCNTSLRNNGYAIAFASNNIQFVRFTSGSSSACATNNYAQYFMNNTYTYNSNTCIIQDNSASLIGGRWYAVKLQYNPSNDQWRLFTRHNVASSFDPTSLSSSDGRGAAIDNTHTSKYLTYMGLYGSLPPENATYLTRYIAMKRLKIRKNVTLTSSPSGSGVCAGIVALPTELLSFELFNENDNAVNLSWQTATESSSDYFAIQRSQNGVDWETIANADGAGFSNELLSYEYDDRSPLPGVNYYRLKQVDFDGEFVYSEERAVNTSEIEDVFVLPNPNNGRFQIINLKEGDRVTLLSLSGDILYNQIAVSASSLLELNDIPDGLYILQINDKVVQRVSVLK